MGDGKFADVLIRDTPSTSSEEAEVPLEFVYRGKNETQSHLVRKVSGAWKIVGIQGTARITEMTT